MNTYDKLLADTKNTIGYKESDNKTEFNWRESQQEGGESRIDELLRLQIEECRIHVDRCSRDVGQSSGQLNEWILSTPVIDYHKTVTIPLPAVGRSAEEDVEDHIFECKLKFIDVTVKGWKFFYSDKEDLNQHSGFYLKKEDAVKGYNDLKKQQYANIS